MGAESKYMDYLRNKINRSATLFLERTHKWSLMADHWPELLHSR
jgi:hypothetical protein